MNASPGPDPLVGRQAEPDDVDLEEGLAHEVVEPLAQQGARLVQPRGVDEDQLARLASVTIPRMVCRVVCGLRRGDGDLVADEGVGQRRLPGVGATDEAGEARGSTRLRRRCSLAVVRPRARGRPCSRRSSSDGAAARRSTMTVAMRWRRPAIRSAVSDSPATSQRRAEDRHPPDGLADEAADGVDLVLVDVDVEEVGEVVDVHRGRHPDAARRRGPRHPGASRSYSSAISPTISSMMSSMVTSPAVPPYSSTTTAKWLWSRCISRSRSSTGLLSGT